jgi:Rps23 Pro-64 3,4-dihydroxylase Tpa1-like proline 4-hydroxylase
VLNPDLDLAGLAEDFSKRGWVWIRDAFRADVAESIHASLRDEVPWRLSVYDNRRPPKERAVKLTMQELQQMGQQNRAALQAEVLRQARDQFQYVYRSFDLLEGYRRGEAPDLFLYRLMQFLAGDVFFDFARRLLGDQEIDRIDGHATCYVAGHFLKDHADESPFEQRRAAYVIGMTRDWEADMGGVLMFLDDNGRVEEAFVPGFNTITVFRVPVRHLVSEVSPWVNGQRLSVTGWLTVSGT